MGCRFSMLYIYVYTADNKKFDRLNKVIEFIKDKDVIFCVNDLESIAFIKSRGFKAMNVDALIDLFSLDNGSDEFYICTPEDSTYLKASFANVKDIC